MVVVLYSMGDLVPLSFGLWFWFLVNLLSWFLVFVLVFGFGFLELVELMNICLKCVGSTLVFDVIILVVHLLIVWVMLLFVL